ncbi:AraC family transcriptional regulator [Seonamhaeicola aphaedonensis]|uniref:AraC family transcriptional regulator n=1 Tax=Seonamhaeicola aphaedonensis TaxID=1461338 RepID=A0A3D9HN64_9FLAO|nr:AraC family transcriptional regulator [Seonamhaeicola aphaedonensis]RED50336.1 AraC family transcriptional regulator [Seonamhaeicola aphaedonensis]
MTKKTESDTTDDLTLKEGFVGQKMIAFHKSIINISKVNDITKNFYVSDLGYYPRAHHHYRMRKKGANQYIFIYCTKGKGEIYINNEKTEINPNQFFIIPKKVKHEYKAFNNDPWSIYWFHFNGPLADELYKRYESTQIKNYKNIPFSLERINSFEKIFNLFNSTYLENHIEYANLLSLNFISYFVYHDFEYSIKSNSDDTIVNSIIKHLLDNLEKKFTLDEIASKFNYSKSYLHTKFKAKTGYPLLVFFNLKKVQKACELLNYTDLSIKEISFEVGFEDPLYFSRIFKNFMGKSPRNYKQSLHK